MNNKTTGFNVDGVEITVRWASFRKTGSYQGAISTGSGGVISGGGTRTHTFYSYGFEIRAKNTTTESRDVWFKMAKFRDVVNKVVEEKLQRNLTNIKPGYTEILELDFDTSGDTQKRLYLEEVIVQDSARNSDPVRLTKLISMYEEGDRNKTPEQARKNAIAKFLGKVITVIVWSFIGLIVFGFLALLFIANNEDKTPREKQLQAAEAVEAASKARYVSENLTGHWYCIAPDGARSEPIYVVGSTMSQGYDTVELDKDISLSPTSVGLHKEVHKGVASYVEPNSGAGTQLSSLGNGKLELRVLIPKKGSREYTIIVHTCSH